MTPPAPASLMPAALGSPRLHLRRLASTNLRARELALAGAPHGTLVTAGEQLAGRGRQGRSWSAPAGTAVLMSLVLHGESSPLLSLAAGVAVAEAVDAVRGTGDAVRSTAAAERARLKWPNDVLLDGLKVAGVLVEGRPLEHWTVLGVGINVALDVRLLPPELHGRAGGLGLGPDAVEPTLTALLSRLERWLGAGDAEIVAAVSGRDALLDQPLRWADGSGLGAGITPDGRLLVEADGAAAPIALDAGEVHLSTS